MGDVVLFLASRQFKYSMNPAFYVFRVVPHPTVEEGQRVGVPVWHFIQMVPGFDRGPEYRACQNERGPDKLVMVWTSPWFDSVEACYVYAELNQWGM